MPDKKDDVYGDHISHKFNDEMMALKSEFLKMGGLVEKAILDAATSLETRDEELAEQVRAGDRVIDELEEQINEEAARVIALRAPTAVDLRVILTVMKIAGNLERIGDYAKNMAKRTTVLAQMAPINGASAALRRMAREIELMLRDALDAYIQRDADLVLLDCRNPLGNGQVLPAGILREFPTALRRADLFLLTRCDNEAAASEELPGPVFRSCHRLSQMAFPLQGEAIPLESLREKKGVAFAGIADPELFFRQLREKGLFLTETVAFGDHVPYDANDLARLKRAGAGADFLVTTEKDAVKLADRDPGLLCYQVPLKLEIEQHDELMSHIDALVKSRRE